MKTLIISILQMAMIYYSGNAQNQYNTHNSDLGQNTRIVQNNNHGDFRIFQKTTPVENRKPAEKSLRIAVAQLDRAKTVSDYTKYKQSFSDLASQQPQNWLAFYYVAYCDARMALLTLKQNNQSIQDYCLNGLTYAKKAAKLLNPLTDSNALSEIYVVVSMLHWAGEQAEIAIEGFVSSNYSYHYLVNARQLNNKNPRVLYWDAWLKLNGPKYSRDKFMGRNMALLSSSMIKPARSGAWPNWGKAENQELLNQQ
jgi:hypothetical protein